ncbi:MAG: ComEC/Rec2 family competence protein [Candidatus Nanopelagicales bacterium]
MVRRWWAVAAGAALVAGVAVAALHAQSVQASALPVGTSHELAVRLSTSPQTRQGLSGPWWTATGQITAGAPRATVSISGDGAMAAHAADTVIARMAVQEPRARGQSSALQVTGPAEVRHAGGWPAQARMIMRQVSGDGDPGWLLSGMTFGQDEGLSDAARKAMRDAGLTHLTAVSGANIAILLFAVHWLAGWVRVPRTPRVVLCAVVLVGFVMTVGSQPSVLRAAVMAGLSLVAGLVGGRRAAAHVLQVSAVLLLLVDPWLAFSVGFILSVAATAGLIALIDRGPLAATLAAQMATFPILVALGGAVGPRTVLANVLAMPLAAAVPILGLGAVSLQWSGLPAHVPAAAGRWLSAGVLKIAEWDTVPHLTWAPGWGGVVLAAAVSGAVLVLGRRHIALVSLLLVGVMAATIRATAPWPPPDWWIVGCDVGQGDGFVARSQGRVVVIDTGPDAAAVDACLSRLGVSAIDLLVLTHFHADHVDGLAGVLRGRTVAQVWTTPCLEPAEQHSEALPLLSALPVATPPPGTTVAVGDMHLTVVWPQRIIEAGSVPNNASLGLLVVAPQGRAVFLGDIEPEAQRALLAGYDVRADIVKVPHHGSAQFVPDLAERVAADIALVGVGAGNPFGHPAPQAVSAWQAAGARVYTTQDNGDIAVTDAREVVVRGPEQSPLG